MSKPLPGWWRSPPSSRRRGRTPRQALAHARNFKSHSLPDSVSREDLKSKDALTCLTKALSDLQSTVKSVEAAASSKEVLRAAKAIRVIFEDRKGDAIEEFRKGDDLRAITVLTFGARSEDYDTRLNTTLVLGNVIDDTTACVPIDHLYDPKISVNGRANLLAIVSSAVSSMAGEDLGDVEKVSAYTRNQLPRGATDSLRILDNLDARVSDRRGKTRGRTDGGANSRTADCRGYKPLWPPGAPKMTVYTQIGADSADERAKYETLKRTLPANAYIVPAVENVKRSIARNEVRYCNPDNKNDAKALAEVIAGNGFNAPEVVEINKCDPDKNRNILEVWLQTGA
jgi:hypothetical protein